MRLYIPATSTLIETLVVSGQIPVDIGFAVTPEMRNWYHAEDEEELEYLASMAAARASLELLAGDPSAKRRRAVLALEVEAVTPLPADPLTPHDRAAVRVDSPLRFELVDAALVDDPAVQEELTAALALWGQQTEDAHFAREQAQSHELLWFARQEIPYIF